MAVQLQSTILGVVGLVGALLLPISPAGGAPSATCDGKPATIIGTDQEDDLEGTEGDDVVSLGDGQDLFHGHGGDDTICAGTGPGDSIKGGPGNDRLIGEGGRDFLYGGSGDDTLWGGRGADYLYDEGFEECPPDEFCQEAAGDGADDLSGGRGRDDLLLRAAGTGDPGAVGGADEADGGPGEDTVSYTASPVGVVIDVAGGTGTGAAVDTFVAVERHIGSDHADTILGTEGPDVLSGHAGVDEIHGFSGDDLLGGHQGLIVAGPGQDVYDADFSYYPRGVEVRLGAGDDLARFEEGQTTVDGGRGDDEFRSYGPEEGVDASAYEHDVSGGPGRDLLTFKQSYDGPLDLDAGRGRAVVDCRGECHQVVRFTEVEKYLGGKHTSDLMVGSSRGERFGGLAGNDIIRGRGGNDVLVGGDGRDAVNGGAGVDDCSGEVRRRCEHGAR